MRWVSAASSRSNTSQTHLTSVALEPVLSTKSNHGLAIQGPSCMSLINESSTQRKRKNQACDMIFRIVLSQMSSTVGKCQLNDR